jgi:hypothetical protein
MAKVDGQVVKVGDYVCFKSDVEQCGKITKIEGNQLTLFRDDEGFEGDYIGGSNYTTETADRCWIE